MFEPQTDCERIIVKNRYGFVQCAVIAGTPIVPVYHFGQTQLFQFGPHCLQTLSRKLKTSIGVHHNKYGLPFPHQVELMPVLGKVINVKQMNKEDEGFKEYVQEIHDKVVDELLRMYILILF